MIVKFSGVVTGDLVGYSENANEHVTRRSPQAGIVVEIGGKSGFVPLDELADYLVALNDNPAAVAEFKMVFSDGKPAKNKAPVKRAKKNSKKI